MSTAEQMKAIAELKGKALREKFEAVTGKATKSNNRSYLLRQIEMAIEQAPAVDKPARANRAKESKQRDARLPAPGTVIERDHDGKKIKVTVLDDGFRYGDQTYRSLSAIAKEVTGTSWNGLLFFRLIPYARSEQAAT